MVKNEGRIEDDAWMTKAEALGELKKSERSLDRLVTAGRVERRTRQRPGKPPEPIFSRSDIRRLTAVDAFPVPQDRVKQLAASDGSSGATAAAQMLGPLAALAHLLRAPSAPVAQPEPQWITLEPAAQYSGLSSRLLRAYIDDGSLPAVRDGRQWKVRRADLDALRAKANGSSNGHGTEPLRATSVNNGSMARTVNGRRK